MIAKLRLASVAGTVWFLVFLLVSSLRAQTSPPALKVLITPEQPFVAPPNAVRIRMHIHNATQQTLWLYRRAKGKHPAERQVQEENRPVITRGGSTVEVELLPADSRLATAVVSPARATVLEYVNMPKPRLVKLASGGDYEETSIVHVDPALADGQKALWGTYRVTLTYGASYSNADEFQRNLGETLWEGEVTSNTINLELRPPLPDSVGVVTGSAVGQDLQPRAGVRVSLSDEQGQLIDQQVTEADGQFSFARLPQALYWVTGRREGDAQDTVTFRHVELTSAAPASTQLVLYPSDSVEAKKFVHKPVLLRVFNRGGRPVGGVDLDAIFSNGDVIEDLKATTADDGTVAMELLPGRSAFSLKQRGCADQVERIDLAPGEGVESFKFGFDCVKK
jgi:hypothetical protein